MIFKKHQKYLLRFLMLNVLFISQALAQDEGLPFDDLDAADTAAPPSSQTPEKEEFPPDETASDSSDKVVNDSAKPLDDKASETVADQTSTDENLTNDNSPDENSTDKLTETELSLDEGETQKEEGLRDLLTPDESVQQAESAVSPAQPPEAAAKPDLKPIPEALRESEILSTLDPSDQFFQIPLRPQMSDANWKKFSGPKTIKEYRIRKGDTLWGISERFFGNPYLWPKVWQLNAQLGNPHVIDSGITLSFFLGNPNSAPTIALKLKEGGTEFLPLMQSFQKLGFLEELEQRIYHQSQSSDPPFQHFLMEDLPEEIARVPERNLSRFFFHEGDRFEVEDVRDGEYSVIRGMELGEGNLSSSPFSAYRVKWLGNILVSGGSAVITRSFAEIQEGDYIVSKNFELSGLSLREETLGEKESKRLKIVSIEEGSLAAGGSSGQLMGVRFSSRQAGVTPGAILKLNSSEGQLGTAVLVHREGRMGTFWIYDSKREVLSSDRFE